MNSKISTFPLLETNKGNTNNSNNRKGIQLFNKNKNKKNTILYPIFAKCTNYTTDEFWKNLFDNLSIGKCPKSIYISNCTIYSSNKRKGFSYIIPTSDVSGSDNPENIFTELRELLISNTSICSSTDVSIKKKEIREKQEDDITNTTTWSEIRKKNLREILIIKFVVRMKKKYKFDWKKSRDLYIMIQIGFIYKTQTSKDVNFKNKRVDSIDGIVYNEEKNIFVNEYTNNEIPKEKDELDDDDNYLYYYWDRYVSAVSKRI
jgi:hypothetical protein